MLFVFHEHDDYHEDDGYHEGDGKASQCQWSHWRSRRSEVGRKSVKVYHTLAEPLRRVVSSGMLSRA